MIMEIPTAIKVPAGRLLPGSFRSPDMLTPWVNPVTAGKKMAKMIQNPGPPRGFDQLSIMRELSPVHESTYVKGDKGQDQKGHDSELEFGGQISSHPG